MKKVDRLTGWLIEWEGVKRLIELIQLIKEGAES